VVTGKLGGFDAGYISTAISQKMANSFGPSYRTMETLFG
jgi:hypothetical protein